MKSESLRKKLQIDKLSDKLGNNANGPKDWSIQFFIHSRST